MPRLRRKLARIEPESRVEITAVLNRTAQRLLADMKSGVAVSDEPGPQGHLRDAMSYRVAKSGLHALVGLLTPRQRRAFRYWRYVEYGTVHMPAQPFARPAMQEAEQSYPADIRQAVNDALQRVVSSG